MRLAGKVALISGGARGMGAAEARLLAREGAKVVIGDLLEEEGKQVAAEINEAGGAFGKDVVLVEADDGTDPDVASQAADRLLAILERFTPLDPACPMAPVGW